MVSHPVKDKTVKAALETTKALIDAAEIVLSDLHDNQHALEDLLECLEKEGSQ